ncbi:hypothetical protein AA984_20790 [Brevibacillus formosus]|uniref:Uncharacterized protein n=1 Tax=Brevibacillus formosus TaxID=54913 RepID=A0A837KK55_9BACL|nr:hypothetical protein AA984_20790 [Brevibacillus formosus]GED61448.1 hypothetical protein BFO01nite_55800 [Brevibacillus formosus]
MVAVNDLATNKMSSGFGFVIIFGIIPGVFCLTARRMIRASGPFFVKDVSTVFIKKDVTVYGRQKTVRLFLATRLVWGDL